MDRGQIDSMAQAAEAGLPGTTGGEAASPDGPVILEQTVTGERDAFAGVRERLGHRRFTPSERPRATRICVIAMLPRTGSTALCSLLEQTGLVGVPDEYLNPRGVLQHVALRYRTPDLRTYLDTLLRERQSRDGLFSLKVTILDVRPMLGFVRELLGEDVRFVYLRRNDVVAQAVSLYIAEVSGVWHRDAQGEPYRVRPTEVEPAFDRAAILRRMDEILEYQKQWERMFAHCGITPLRVTYEEFVEDPKRVVTDILHHFGQDWGGEVDLQRAVTARLADERNEEWIRRLRDPFRL